MGERKHTHTHTHTDIKEGIQQTLPKKGKRDKKKNKNKVNTVEKNKKRDTGFNSNWKTTSSGSEDGTEQQDFKIIAKFNKMYICVFVIRIFFSDIHKSDETSGLQHCQQFLRILHTLP